MTRVAVIGAHGWLGRAVAGLLPPDDGVMLLDRAEAADLDAVLLRDLLAPGPDLVVVNAAGRLRGSPTELEADNVQSTAVLVDALTGSGAHLVHLGSPAEYGDPGSAEPIPEAHPMYPVSDYGRSKARATEVVRAYDGTWCILRPFNVVDREMIEANPVAIIRAQIETVDAVEGVIELPAARAVRDHVSRDFVARSVLRAATDRLSGTFNLCSGVGLTYASIAEAIAERRGIRIRVVDLGLPGIRSVVGDPGAWAERTGLREQHDAAGIAGVVCG